jgi:hypothetical protein
MDIPTAPIASSTYVHFPSLYPPSRHVWNHLYLPSLQPAIRDSLHLFFTDKEDIRDHLLTAGVEAQRIAVVDKGLDLCPKTGNYTIKGVPSDVAFCPKSSVCVRIKQLCYRPGFNDSAYYLSFNDEAARSLVSQRHRTFHCVYTPIPVGAAYSSDAEIAERFAGEYASGNRSFQS